MSYPTLAQVNEATREQICSWWRFLPSPGSNAIAANLPYEEVHRVMDAEAKIMDRIAERFHELGGFTPEISKHLGWGCL